MSTNKRIIDACRKDLAALYENSDAKTQAAYHAAGGERQKERKQAPSPKDQPRNNGTIDWRVVASLAIVTLITAWSMPEPPPSLSVRQQWSAQVAQARGYVAHARAAVKPFTEDLRK